MVNEINKVTNIDSLNIIDNNKIYFGGNQMWYSTSWKTKAGCGPTNATLFLMYLSLNHSAYKGLMSEDIQKRPVFMAAMEEIWEYVTPTAMGVFKADIFVDGVQEYSKKKQFEIPLAQLEISKCAKKRPSSNELSDFIIGNFEKNSIVPFLNNSNGGIPRLDNWHWVSIVSFIPETGIAIIADEGMKKEIDLYMWLEKTTLGGAFIGI